MTSLLMNSSSTHSADYISQVLHASVASRPDATLWLAVDCSENSTFDSDDLGQALASEAAVQIWLTHPQIDASAEPRWLPLNTAVYNGSALVQASIAQALAEVDLVALRQGRGRHIAGWLELQGGVLPAKLHIARHMIQRHPQGYRCLLRLHDPAVLWALWHLLTPEQQRLLLGPIATWWILDPRGQLMALTAPENAGADEATDRPASSLFSFDQWIDIDHITAFNRMLRQVGVADAAPGHLQHIHRIAMKAMRRALALGFSETEDLAAFAAHAVTVHPEFDRHPLVQHMLAQRKPGCYYTALAEALTPDDWAAVQSMQFA